MHFSELREEFARVLPVPGVGTAQPCPQRTVSLVLTHHGHCDCYEQENGRKPDTGSGQAIHSFRPIDGRQELTLGNRLVNQFADLRASGGLLQLEPSALLLLCTSVPAPSILPGLTLPRLPTEKPKAALSP